MIFRSVLVLVLSGLLFISYAEQPASPKDLTALISKSANTGEIEKALRLLGLPDSLITRSNKASLENSNTKLFQKDNFVRADVFQCNLDN